MGLLALLVGKQLHNSHFQPLWKHVVNWMEKMGEVCVGAAHWTVLQRREPVSLSEKLLVFLKLSIYPSHSLPSACVCGLSLLITLPPPFLGPPAASLVLPSPFPQSSFIIRSFPGHSTPPKTLLSKLQMLLTGILFSKASNLTA